jgi:hypothetical protein
MIRPVVAPDAHAHAHAHAPAQPGGVILSMRLLRRRMGHPCPHGVSPALALVDVVPLSDLMHHLGGVGVGGGAGPGMQEGAAQEAQLSLGTLAEAAEAAAEHAESEGERVRLARQQLVAAEQGWAKERALARQELATAREVSEAVGPLN